MRGGVNFFELFYRDLGINLGGIEVGVSKDLLDIAYISPIVQH